MPSPSAPAAAAFERVLVYVTEHPGTSPKAIIDETGLRRPVVFQALAEGCESGPLSKAGRWRNVTYSPAGHTPSDGEVAAVPKPKYRRSRIGAADIVEDVVAWIEMYPGCCRSELTTAFPVTSGVLRRALDVAKEQHHIRMEGTRVGALLRARRVCSFDREPARRWRGGHRGDAITTSDSPLRVMSRTRYHLENKLQTSLPGRSPCRGLRR